MVVGFLTAFGMFGSILFTPLVFQGILGISATNSGALITPMMFGLIGASTLTGFLMQRIKYYRFLGTFGVLVMIAGMWQLSQIVVSTPEWRVVADLIVVGLGLGVTFPLYLTVVQTALPREFMGVASSQIQFWRNLGGTVGSAILGAVLANRLPGYLGTRVADLHLPSQVVNSLPKGGSANSILDPTLLAKLPVAFVHAIRLALSDTLHDIYLFAGITGDFSVNHVNGTVEQAGDKFFQANIFVDRPFGAGLEFHQNIDVAVGMVVAARDRTEHGRAADSARPQGGLGFLQSGYDIIAAHGNILPNSGIAFQQRRFARFSEL